MKVSIDSIVEAASRHRAGYKEAILESAHIIEPPYAYFLKDVYMKLNKEFLKDQKRPRIFMPGQWQNPSVELPSQHTIMTPTGPKRQGCCG